METISQKRPGHRGELNAAREPARAGRGLSRASGMIPCTNSFNLCIYGSQASGSFERLSRFTAFCLVKCAPLQ